MNLAGNGLVLGNMIVSNTLAPGMDAAGTLSITGSAAFVATSLFDFELDLSDQTVGGGVNDLLVLSGSLTLDGTLNVTNYTAGTPSAGDYWTLLTYDPLSSLTDNGLELGTLPDITGIGIWALNLATEGEVRLEILVPEPHIWTGLLAALGLIAILARRRRI